MGQHRARSIRLTTIIVASALLGGCVVGPNYVTPSLDAPPGWHSSLESGLRTQPSDPNTRARWWETFDDPVLGGLIEVALKNNLDLELAKARVREARARRGVSAAARFPTIEASVGARSSRVDPDEGASTRTDLYDVGFDARWELDLFGGKQRALEAAQAQLEASEEHLHDVLVSLVAELALNYVDVRALQARLDIAENNLGIQQDSYEIVTWRNQAGLSTELDVQQAAFSLEQTRAQLPSLRAALQQTTNRVAFLLGKAPGAMDEMLSTPAPVPVAPVEVAVGVPADMLRRRPDVRRAERQLAAQTAQVGVATAARYPDFSLSGSIAVEASSLSNLASSPTLVSSIGASLAAPIFDAGRLRQNVEIQNALQEQSFLDYRSAVLNALQEVENAMVAYAQEQQRRNALLKAAQAARLAAALAANQYEAGLADFQAVLIAQRSALSLEDQLATSSSEISANLIRLFKALGGGWSPPLTTSAASSEG